MGELPRWGGGLLWSSGFEGGAQGRVRAVLLDTGLLVGRGDIIYKYSLCRRRRVNCLSHFTLEKYFSRGEVYDPLEASTSTRGAVDWDVDI